MQRLLAACSCCLAVLGCQSIAGLDDLRVRAGEPDAAIPNPAGSGTSGAGGAGTTAWNDAGDSAVLPVEAGTSEPDGGQPPDTGVPDPITCASGSAWSADEGKCVDLCDLAMCDPNAQCAVVNDAAKCDCPSPYIGNGETCTYDASCAMLGCDEERAACIEMDNGTRACECLDGYTGSGTTCTNIDECAQSTGPCDSNAECDDTEGGFICTCNPGYDPQGQTSRGPRRLREPAVRHARHVRRQGLRLRVRVLRRLQR